MTRIRQAALLVRPSLRTTALFPLLPAGALGLGVLSLDGDPLLLLRLGGAALCVAAAFALDDAAAETTASSPTPLVFRRLVRLVLVLPPVAAIWALFLLYTDHTAGAALTLELAAMLALALAASTLAVELVPDRRGGLVGGPALLLFLAGAALVLPDRWTIFAPGPDDPRWAASHGRWALVLALALVALVHASLDPGRQRLLPRLLPRGSEPAPGNQATERA